jgi:hypothetical protein
MALTKEYVKHICCLEGDWIRDLCIRQSIKSALDFLETNSAIKYIHRNCVTREQLRHYIKEFSLKKYEKYSILYLAYHGDPNLIYVGKDIVTLDELAEMAEGRLKNMIVHFGSCSTRPR